MRCSPTARAARRRSPPRRWAPSRTSSDSSASDARRPADASPAAVPCRRPAARGSIRARAPLRAHAATYRMGLAEARGGPMSRKRRSHEAGHKRKYLVVIDDTPECDRAVYWASQRAARTNSSLVMLRVIETQDRNQQWLGVADIMRAEAHEAANAAL